MSIIPNFVRKKIEHRPNLLKIVDNISWLALDKVVRMGAGLLVGVWFARYLGPEQFGLYSFAAAFAGLFAVIAGLGLQGIVVRDLVIDPTCKEEILGTAALLHWIGGLIAYVLVLCAIFWLRPEDLMARLLVAILGATMLFKSFEVAAYWFESQVLSKYLIWVQNGSFLIFTTIKVALILNKAPLIAFAWLVLIEALVVGILMLLVLSLSGTKPRKLKPKIIRAKTLLKDSWPLLMSGIAVMIYMKIDQIMLGQILGDEAVGIYSAALRISEAWYFIPMVIVVSVFPAIVSAKKNGEFQYYQRLQHLYDLMACLSIGIALPMTFLSTSIVVFLFGERFIDSGAVLSIHIWASVFVFMGVASGRWFILEKKQMLSFKRTLIGALINVGLNFWLIPAFGVIGAAFATLIAQMSVGLLFDGLQKETHRIFFMKINSINPLRVIRELKRYL